MARQVTRHIEQNPSIDSVLIGSGMATISFRLLEDSFGGYCHDIRLGLPCNAENAGPDIAYQRIREYSRPDQEIVEPENHTI